MYTTNSSTKYNVFFNLKNILSFIDKMGKGANNKAEWQLKIDEAYHSWKYNDLHKNIKCYFNECKR